MTPSTMRKQDHAPIAERQFTWEQCWAVSDGCAGLVPYHFAAYLPLPLGLSQRCDNWPATANRTEPDAAEREGHHHAGGRPRPDHPVRGILTSADARSHARVVSVSKTCRSAGTSQARPTGVCVGMMVADQSFLPPARGRRRELRKNHLSSAGPSNAVGY